MNTKNTNPNTAQLVTADITNFWLAYDQGLKSSMRAEIQQIYFKQASAGLQDFFELRIGSVDELVDTIEQIPNYYASIREQTLLITEEEKKIRAAFYAMKYLYPGALFPDIYFLIGRMNTIGTFSESGLLIGTEMFGNQSGISEDGLSAWHKANIKPYTAISSTVAHELIHYNQPQDYLFGAEHGLLSYAIVEGAADFLGEMISGQLLNQAQHEYGTQNEGALWHKFRNDDMFSLEQQDDWFYHQDPASNRPSDLGYFLGYQIVETYYQNAKDTGKAIAEIINMDDPQAFLAKSGYVPK